MCTVLLPLDGFQIAVNKYIIYIYSVLLHSFLFGTYEEFVLVNALTCTILGWVVTSCMGGRGLKCQHRKWGILTKVSCSLLSQAYAKIVPYIRS